MDTLIDIAIRICSVSAILLIWLRTNAVYEYLGWLPIPLFKNYKNMNTLGMRPNLVTYITGLHSNFFIRLIICPKCVGIWISVLCCFNHLTLIPVAYIGGLYIYNKLTDAQNI